MEHLVNQHKDCPNQHENNHKLCVETGHLLLSLIESQWKLRQQHDQNFPMEGKEIKKKKISKSKRAGLKKSQSGI